MRLELDPNGTTLDGRLEYRDADHAFDFTPSDAADLTERTGDRGTSSVALMTLQLELNVSSGAALYVWGYCPREKWVNKRLPTPSLYPASARVVTASPREPGVAIRFPDAEHWSCSHDIESGWVYCGEDPPITSAAAIATGVGLAVTDGLLRGVWLKPTPR
jgi:hypothetical protein